MADGRGGGTLRITGAHVHFDRTRALDGVDLAVGDGEMVVLLGPSGCGKTTLLRATAGLQLLDAGSIELDGQDLTGRRPDQRGIGLMFQDEVLFPHFDVEGNVAFGLRMAKVPLAERRRRVAEVLALVGLSGFGGRDVATLSGGEAQRVSLARALAPEHGAHLTDDDRTVQLPATIVRRRFRGDRYELRLEADIDGVCTTLDAITTHGPAVDAGVTLITGPDAVLPLEG